MIPEIPGGELSLGRRFFKLKNTVKHYDWGSPRRIPELLGLENPGRLPWAELWMGVHPEAPSELILEGGSLPLSRLIDREPPFYLGREAAERFGTLPFLFKLLAAEKPLSIQAHPNKEQALVGWERENALSIPLDAPNRNYRDRNHKPEILAAIDPFTAMCGFREPGEILRGLECFFFPLAKGERRPFEGLLTGLKQSSGELRGFLSALFALSPAARHGLSVLAGEGRERLCRDHGDYRAEWELCASFAAAYPGDPAVIAPLYLNLIHLDPGEAMYLPAGVLHAYVRGFGVELMANSDNVLRGGLTAKHMDLGELLKVLNFSPFRPKILRAPQPFSSCFTFPSGSEEFSLSLLKGEGGEEVFPDPGPAILVLVDGEAKLSAGGETLHLGSGGAAFIAAGKAGEVRLRGRYTLYAAGLGRDNRVPR